MWLHERSCETVLSRGLKSSSADAFLRGFRRVSDLDDPARGGIGIGKGMTLDVLHAAARFPCPPRASRSPGALPDTSKRPPAVCRAAFRDQNLFALKRPLSPGVAILNKAACGVRSHLNVPAKSLRVCSRGHYSWIRQTSPNRTYVPVSCRHSQLCDFALP